MASGVKKKMALPDPFEGFPTDAEEADAEIVAKELEAGLPDDVAEALGLGLPFPLPDLPSFNPDGTLNEALVASGFQALTAASSWEIGGQTLPSFFKGTRSFVQQKVNRIKDLAESRRVRRIVQEAQYDVNRADIAYLNATFRGRALGYYNAIHRYLEDTEPVHPSDVSRNRRTFRRFLRGNLGSEMLAFEASFRDSYERRGIPVPPKREFRRMLSQAITETLQDTDDLVQTIERWRGGFSPYDPTKVGRLVDTNASLFQRFQDRAERRLVEWNVKEGNLQPVKQWRAFDPKNPGRNFHLNGEVRRLNEGFKVERGSRVSYYGPRDPRMDPADSSLSKSYLAYQPTRKLAEKIAAERNAKLPSGSIPWEWHEIIDQWL